MRSARIAQRRNLPKAAIYNTPEKLIRPPRTVYFVCPEKACTYDHAFWSGIAQHLFNHHGYTQEQIDMEEIEQRKTRRNKNWVKKKLLKAQNAEANEENIEDDFDQKPSEAVLSAIRELVPKGTPGGRQDSCACPIATCGVKVADRSELNKHALRYHLNDETAVGTFEVRQELFENEDDFRDWKLRLEEANTMHFSCDATHAQGLTKAYFYVCHRSGRVVKRLRLRREAAGRETRRKKKVIKSQDYCTAFMRARRDQFGRVHVTYSISHIGHDIDPSILPLTNEHKKIIYDRVVRMHETASMSLIATRIRESCPDPSSRLHYTSMTDVLEVIKAERRRLDRAGGEEAAAALPIFTSRGKRGRRKLGEEVLLNGVRHKPPRRMRAVTSPSSSERRGDTTLDEEEARGRGRGRKKKDAVVKMEIDDADELLEPGDSGHMPPHYHHHADIDDGEVDDYQYGDAVPHDDGDDEIDQFMMDEGAAQQMHHEDGAQTPSTSRIAAPPAGTVMNSEIVRKHKLDEHIDNICEAIVRKGDSHALQSFLDTIQAATRQYEYSLRH